MVNRRYCPDCDDKPPEFETHFIYAVYIRAQRKTGVNRYIKVGWYCKNCHNFFVVTKEDQEIKKALTLLI